MADVFNKQSEKYKLNKTDMIKLLKGAGIAGASAALVYLSDSLKLIDWGQYTELAIAVGCVIINFLRKLLSGK